MNDEMNKNFVEITLNIFEKLFNTSLTSGEAYVAESKDRNWDISSVIGVVGDYDGVITVRLKQETADKLLENTRIESPDVAAKWNLTNDMIGEIVNNISGNVLSNISKDHFSIAPPITIQGKGHIMQWPKDAPIIAIPFSFEFGTLEIQYSLLKK